jgi:hypothetical protein
MTALKVKVLVTATVLAHAIVVLLHAWAHLTLAVNMPWLQNAFIISVIMTAPIVAGVLAWTRHRRAGIFIFAASMFGALVFGAYYHFLDSGMDHISRVPTDGWGALFRLTAILLVIIEGWGSIVGWWGYSLVSRREKEDSYSS